MLAKVRLLLWIGALGCTAVVLLRSASWPGAGDPPAATMAAAQVVAGALAAYLALATVLAIRLPRLAPRFVQQLVAAAVGTTMALAPVAAGAAPQRAATASDAPVLHKLAGDTTSSTSSTTTTAVAPAGSGRDPLSNQQVIPPRTDGRSGEVTVVPGDHLWGIAERTLTARLGRAPSDAEITPYWSQLIDANRDRLATGDPDLIFAGQVFRLPS